jgi:hypothetical protein
MSPFFLNENRERKGGINLIWGYGTSLKGDYVRKGYRRVNMV